MTADRVEIAGIEWFCGERHQLRGALQSVRLDFTLESIEVQQGTREDRIIIEQLNVDGEPYTGYDPLLVRENQGIVYAQRLRTDGEGHVLKPEEPCLVRVTLPDSYNGAVNVSSNSGPIKVVDVHARNLDLHTRSGALEVRSCRFRTDVQVQGASGSAVVDDTESPEVNIEMHSGSVHTHDIRCSNFRSKTFSGSQKHEVRAEGRITLEGHSGSVMLDGTAEELATRTVSGAQKITIWDLRAAEMSSKSGSVYLTVPSSESLHEVKASTMSGSIHLLLPPDVRPIPKFDSRSGTQRFISADFVKTRNEVFIHVSTMSGSLSIKPYSG